MPGWVVSSALLFVPMFLLVGTWVTPEQLLAEAASTTSYATPPYADIAENPVKFAAGALGHSVVAGTTSPATWPALVANCTQAFLNASVIGAAPAAVTVRIDIPAGAAVSLRGCRTAASQQHVRMLLSMGRASAVALDQWDVELGDLQIVPGAGQPAPTVLEDALVVVRGRSTITASTANRPIRAASSAASDDVHALSVVNVKRVTGVAIAVTEESSVTAVHDGGGLLYASACCVRAEQASVIGTTGPPSLVVQRFRVVIADKSVAKAVARNTTSGTYDYSQARRAHAGTVQMLQGSRTEATELVLAVVNRSTVDVQGDDSSAAMGIVASNLRRGRSGQSYATSGTFNKTTIIAIGDSTNVRVTTRGDGRGSAAMGIASHCHGNAGNSNTTIIVTDSTLYAAGVDTAVRAHAQQTGRGLAALGVAAYSFNSDTASAVLERSVVYAVGDRTFVNVSCVAEGYAATAMGIAAAAQNSGEAVAHVSNRATFYAGVDVTVGANVAGSGNAYAVSAFGLAAYAYTSGAADALLSDHSVFHAAGPKTRIHAKADDTGYAVSAMGLASAAKLDGVPRVAVTASSRLYAAGPNTVIVAEIGGNEGNGVAALGLAGHAFNSGTNVVAVLQDSTAMAVGSGVHVAVVCARSGYGASALGLAASTRNSGTCSVGVSNASLYATGPSDTVIQASLQGTQAEGATAMGLAKFGSGNLVAASSSISRCNGAVTTAPGAASGVVIFNAVLQSGIIFQSVGCPLPAAGPPLPSLPSIPFGEAAQTPTATTTRIGSPSSATSSFATATGSTSRTDSPRTVTRSATPSFATATESLSRPTLTKGTVTLSAGVTPSLAPETTPTLTSQLPSTPTTSVSPARSSSITITTATTTTTTSRVARVTPSPSPARTTTTTCGRTQSRARTRSVAATLTAARRRSDTATIEEPPAQPPTPTKHSTASRTHRHDRELTQTQLLAKTVSGSQTSTSSQGNVRTPTALIPSPPPPPSTPTPPLVATTTATVSVVRTLSSAVTTTHELPTPEPRAALPVPKPLADSAVASSGTVAVAGAGASPAAALQVARAVGVLAALTACGAEGHVSPDGPTMRLEFPKSLLPGLRIGPAAGGYHRGAVVAALVGAVAVLALGVAVGLVLRRFVKIRPPSEKALMARRGCDDTEKTATAPPPLVMSALRLARMPGLLVVVAAVAADGIATSLVVLPVAGLLSPGADVALMAVGVAVISGAIAFVLFAVGNGGPATGALVFTDVIVVRSTHGGTNSKKHSGPERLANSRIGRWLLLGHRAWVPRAVYGAGIDGDDGDTTKTNTNRKAATLARLEHLGAAFAKYRGPAFLGGPGATTDDANGARGGSDHGTPPGLLDSLLEMDHDDDSGIATATTADGAGATGVGSRFHASIVMPQIATRYLAIDLALTAVAAGFEGAVWLDCVTGAVGMAATNGVALLLAVAVRPYAVPAKNVLLIIVSAITFIAAATAAAAVVQESTASGSGSAEGLREAAGSMAAAAALLSNISVALLIFRFAVFNAFGLRVVPDPAAIDRSHRRAVELTAISAAEEAEARHTDQGPPAPSSPPSLPLAADVAEILDDPEAAGSNEEHATTPPPPATTRRPAQTPPPPVELPPDIEALLADDAPDGGDVDLDALLRSQDDNCDGDDEDDGGAPATMPTTTPTAAAYTAHDASSPPPHDVSRGGVRRTEEGQRRYEEVEAGLRGQHVVSTPPLPPSATIAATMAATAVAASSSPAPPPPASSHSCSSSEGLSLLDMPPPALPPSPFATAAAAAAASARPGALNCDERSLL